MHRLLFLFLFCAALFAAAEDNTPRAFGRPPLVTLAPVEPVAAAAGKVTDATVHFRIAPGYHVNSNKPKSELLIPTTVKIEPTPQFTIAKITYPAGQDFALKFAPDEKLNVYEGDVAVTTTIRAAKSAKPGSYTLKGELHYQACNDTSCFPPKTLPLEISVTVK